MANAYINVYKGTVTEGGTDGTLVSTGGDYSSPISVSLDASQNESKKVKLAIRCQSGFTTSGNTTIADVGDTNDRWKLCTTENGTYADSITISTAIGTTNTIFWAQASSSSLESAASDRSVSFQVNATIAAV